MTTLATLEQNERLRALPAVQILMDIPALRELDSRFGREAVLSAAREVLAEIRAEIISSTFNGKDARDEALARTRARIERKCAGGIRRVINGTGVILHTGLGRAVLPQAALDEIVSELKGYAAVEVDVESGKRGHRELSKVARTHAEVLVDEYGRLTAGHEALEHELTRGWLARIGTGDVLRAEELDA